MKSKKAKRLARRIARDLFTNGTGQTANRLVLEFPDGHHGGGWAEGPLADRIEGHLLGRKK